MWSVTATGKKFRYDKIDMKQVCLKDIAHSLSYQCRYNGHCHLFYSTAEHSMSIAEYIFKSKEKFTSGKEYTLARAQAGQALLHDAAEAYCSDIPSPFKKLMPEYDKYEKALMSKIFRKYGLPAKLDPLVKELDSRICINEKQALFPSTHPRWDVEDTIEPLEGVVIHGFTPPDIYPAYLKLLEGLFHEYD